jgi:hypothetical protein
MATVHYSCFLQMMMMQVRNTVHPGGEHGANQLLWNFGHLTNFVLLNSQRVIGPFGVCSGLTRCILAA